MLVHIHVPCYSLQAYCCLKTWVFVQQVYPWKPWDTVLVILVTLLVVGVVTDVIVVLLITGATPKTQNCSILPCCTPRESGLTRALQHHMGCNLVLSVVVVLQLMLAVGLFACGLLLLIARALLSEGCKCVLLNLSTLIHQVEKKQLASFLLANF